MSHDTGYFMTHLLLIIIHVYTVYVVVRDLLVKTVCKYNSLQLDPGRVP